MRDSDRLTGVDLGRDIQQHSAGGKFNDGMHRAFSQLDSEQEDFPIFVELT